MYTKAVIKNVKITREEAQALITEVRVNLGELDVYESMNNGYLCRLFSLPLPNDVDWHDDEALFAFARENMPENVRFHRFHRDC